MDTVIREQHTHTRDFLTKLSSTYLENGLSMALWKLPNSTTWHVVASEKPQHESTVSLEESAPGFLFSPFDPAGKKIFLPADEHLIIEGSERTVIAGKMAEGIQDDSTNAPKTSWFTSAYPPPVSPAQATFRERVTLAREEISNGRFEKIVLSRTKTLPLENLHVIDTFVSLCHHYPHAMVSVFSSPLTGTWIGATPELLVSVTRNQIFRTVAVAGTQSFLPGMDLRAVTWTQKDIEEQALVERYIISCFKKIRLREYEEHGPKTVVAGNVLHLKTEFEVDTVATNFPQLGSVMLQLLHPTSAVCGMPLAGSLEFLKNNEGYRREYYSGYLGPVNIQHESHLYVNLRCMQLSGDLGIFYAGAGIMADSDPEKEWRETELKMNTLLAVITK